MRVFDFGGETECKTIEELNELLNKRYENNSNELELYGSENYPFMTILVVDKWACIHFFKDEDDCGHYAFCDENTLDKDGYTIFYTGSATVETRNFKPNGNSIFFSCRSSSRFLLNTKNV